MVLVRAVGSVRWAVPTRSQAVFAAVAGGCFVCLFVCCFRVRVDPTTYYCRLLRAVGMQSFKLLLTQPSPFLIAEPGQTTFRNKDQVLICIYHTD